MKTSLSFGAILALLCASPVDAQLDGSSGTRDSGGRAAVVDADTDGLPDDWEVAFGFSPISSAGTDGPAGDPDDDGVTNVEEFQAGTHPRGVVTRYLAEGVSNAFFETTLALFNPANPSSPPAKVLLRFLKSDGTRVSHFVSVPAGARRTVPAATIAGLANADFSTVIESDELVVVDRTMTWAGNRYGSHADTAVLSPSTTWYLAEGSTSGDFNLFYLLQNPNPSPVQATVRYLLPFGEPPIEKAHTLPPESRTTIYVDLEGGTLASTDVSAVIMAGAPIIVERAMYKDKPGQPFAAGHESAGVTRPALEWFLAEGATGPFFDEFVLIANPNGAAAEISAEYLLLGGGLLTKSYTVPAHGRLTIWVDDEEVPAGSGQKPLANVAVSATVRSINGVPVIVERAMWWPGPEMVANFWYEAHNSPGSISTGTRWALAEGEVGGPWALETYILVANTSGVAGQARVTLGFEDGTSTQRTYDLAAHSRTNVPVGTDFPEAAGRTFGTVVESLGDAPVPIVVERAMYSTVPLDVWSSGTGALATVLADARVAGLGRSSGPSGTVLTIRGSGFSEHSTVTFGTSFAVTTYDSTGELRVVVPFISVAGTIQPLPTGPVELRVDGQHVGTFLIEPLPENPYPPGQVLQTLVSEVSSAWPALVPQMRSTWEGLKTGGTSPVALGYLDALSEMSTTLETTLPEQLAVLQASLDPSALALLERALVAQGFSPGAQGNVARAAVHARATADLSGDLFLEQRGNWPRTASALAVTGLIADALGLLTKNPAPQVAGQLANFAGALIEAWISVQFGEVDAVSVAEGVRSSEDVLDVTLQRAGTTLSAGILVSRQINFLAAATLAAMTIKFRQARIVLYLLGQGQSASVRRVITELVDILARLELLGLPLPGGKTFDQLFTLEEDTQPRPISFDLLEKIWQSSASITNPVIQVADDGTVTVLHRRPQVEEVAFHLPFHRGLVTIPESHVEVLVRVTLPSVEGTWSGIYQYGANCANYTGLETYVLTEDVNGNVTGSFTDDLLSPVVGTTGGSVSGKRDGSAVSLTLSYTFGSAAGVQSRFSGMVAGNTMRGITGNCGGGTNIVLMRP